MVVQVDSQEGTIKIEEEENLQMSVTIHEHGQQLSEAGLARSSAELVLWSTEYQL